MKIFNFSKPYQYATVSAGETKTVFLIKVPSGCKAYIQKTANNWFPNTYLKWKVDDELVEKVERQIAPVNSPKPEIPPIIAVNKIEWIVVNNSKSSFIFEVLQEGAFQQEVN